MCDFLGLADKGQVTVLEGELRVFGDDLVDLKRNEIIHVVLFGRYTRHVESIDRAKEPCHECNRQEMHWWREKQKGTRCFSSVQPALRMTMT